jgi:hypothetical protein
MAHIKRRVRRHVGLGWLKRTRGFVDKSKLEKLLGIVNVVLVLATHSNGRADVNMIRLHTMATSC